MKKLELTKRVKRALESLLDEDAELLERNAAERAIGGKLAVYLGRLFPDHDVDVEYDRDGLDPKALALPRECRGGGRRRVIPDIVIHCRGTNSGNILAIELKKATNREPRDCDRAKLRAMREQLHYQAAVLIDLPAGPGSKERQVKLEWL